MIRHIFLWAVLLAAAIGAPVSAQDFPELTGRVVDAANIIPDAEEAALVQKLEALETQSQRQLVVATVPSLQEYDIADYGYRLGREWGIGDVERNDGALLLVAPNERKVRIETGYGLEGIMTDALSSVIIQNAILPEFRNQDYPAGIAAGVDAIATQLALPPDEAAQIARQADQARQQDGGFPIGTIIWMGFIFFFFVLPMLTRGGRSRRYRGGRRGAGGVVGDIILWEAGKAIARSASGDSGWGGGGFGGGGFGGFSGGGGSFGGGGASGGW